MLDIDDIFFIGSVSDGGEVAIAFIDGIVFRGDGWVDVPVELFDVGHVSIIHCFSQAIIIIQMEQNAA